MKKAKKITKKKIGLLFLCLLAVCLCVWFATRDGNKIQNYAISFGGTSEERSGADLFSRVMNDYFSIDLSTADSNTREHKIHIICDEAAALELGYVLSEWNQNAFVLFCRDGDIYLLSPTAKGISRAATYLARNYVTKRGKILLAEGDYYGDLGSMVKDEVYVGDVSMGKYTITYSNNSLRPVCRELQYYISQTGGGYIPIEKIESGPYIRLEVDKKMNEGARTLTIADGQVTLTAADEAALYENMYLFLNTYLGWSKAGTGQEHISNSSAVIRLPEQLYDVSEPWIEEREALVVLWNVNFTGGANLNENISLKNNVINFSEDQLYEYVKMLKFCGFTGVQATEMCAAWAGAGSYEAVHEKIRMLADAAHSLDMKFTLWVLGADFSDAGWVDPEVPDSFYSLEYPYAKDNPKAIAAFEKYYSIYAQLADCCDRVIGHYYDPGNLNTAEDIAFFAKMLKNKFLMVNPDIDFGISCFEDVYDKAVFVRELGTDVTLYECGYHDNEVQYVPFRTQISQFGVRLGTWAWNTCEMEIDQLAQMNFNMDVIRSVYWTARQYDSIAKPDYWSEMDSYHLLNVFSLYCAGQMLMDPDVESETLYERISVATVGPEYAEDLAEMLSIIQDARSGHSWDTYFWSSDNYILKSEDYPAREILERCDRVIPILKEMINSGLESYTLPLPISLHDLLSLMLPHLLQIQQYAEFRIALDELRESWAQGIPAAKLAERLYEIAEPIKEYDCIIGAWGQIEARAQYEMITAFCQETGLEIPRYMEFHESRKQYILNQLICYQRDLPEPYIQNRPYYQWGLAYGPEETDRLVEELIQDGYLVGLEDGGVYLKNWDNYIYHFISYQ